MSMNSPININSDDTIPVCGETCEFTFKYSDSRCVVNKITAGGGFQCLYIPCESGNSSTAVMYQGTAYIPTGCAIFNGSFHTFDGTGSNGELLIVHSGSGGSGAGKELMVSIPIAVTDATLNTAGKIVDTIIQAVPKNQVSLSTDQSSSTYDVKFPSGNGLFNFTDVVPSNTPFYTYTGNFCYSTTSDTINYIVFPKSAACTISADAATNLNAIVKPITRPSGGMPINSPSMNSIGANARKSGEIYIECNPTGDDGVILYKKSLKGDPATASIDDAMSSPSDSIFENEMFITAVYVICTIIGAGFILLIIKILAEAILKRNTGAATPATPGAAATGK